MTKFGFFASLEEFSPAECLRQIDHAEAAGFDNVTVNDHFHPWFDHKPDGSSANGGNCWSWMPAALERTSDVEVGTGVSAMIHRYHPANVAHRLATLEELYPGRVFLGVGTGEALNESPMGNRMPEYSEQAQRTAEGIRMVRALFEGEFVDYDGKFWDLEGANLYTGPDEAPPIHVAASGPTAARMAGDLGDGLITVFEDPEVVEETLFPQLRRGVKKSDHNASIDDLEKTVHIHVSLADSESAALEPCLPWRGTLLPIFFQEDIADPRYIQDHGSRVGEEFVKDTFVVTTDPADILDATETYVDLGFDQVVYQSHSPDQERFCQAIRDEVMPSF